MNNLPNPLVLVHTYTHSVSHLKAQLELENIVSNNLIESDTKNKL